MADQDKDIVLIDGENLLHQIAHALLAAKKIKHRKDIIKFDLRGLIAAVLSTEPGDLEIIYYTTKIRLVRKTKDLQEKTQSIIDQQRRWKRNLTNQNIQYITAGTLKIRDGLRCRQCGRQEVILQEKGVDVRLSIDLVLMAQKAKYKNIYIVSSDSDILPAFAYAKKIKAPIAYVAHESGINIALLATAKRAVTFTTRQITEAFDRGNRGVKL